MDSAERVISILAPRDPATSSWGSKDKTVTAVRLLYYAFGSYEVTDALVFKQNYCVVVIASTTIGLLQASGFRHISRAKEATLEDFIDYVKD